MMKTLLYGVSLFVLVLGASLSAATKNVPIGQWKMDETVTYQASTNRVAVPSEIYPTDPNYRLALGESADNPIYPYLTSDGDGASGLPGDKAVDFTGHLTRAFCTEFNLVGLGYPGPSLDMAFEMDLKPTDDITTQQTIVYMSTKWEIRISAGNVTFYVYPGPASVRVPITPNAWNHVYAECVGQDLSITVDGVTDSETEPGIDGIIVSTTRLYAGVTSGSSLVRPYNGLLDELTIYEVQPTIIESYENVITTVDLQPALLSAVVLNELNTTLVSADFTCADPNVTLQNPGGTLNAPTIEAVSVSGSYPHIFDVTLTVENSGGTVESVDAEVQVYGTECQAAANAPSWNGYADYDLGSLAGGAVSDCLVNLEDVAGFALQWLDDRRMTVQENY